MSDSKVLMFLDIDGVLHPISAGVQFVDSCVKSLAEAISEFNVEIVVSSTWRESYSLGELRSLLAPLQKPVIDVTPVIDDPFVYYVRYREVIQYLEIKGQSDRSWIAVDDTAGFYPTSAPVFLTHPRIGFSHADVERFKAFAHEIFQSNDTV
jgi:hypothetical protein